jgi:starch synthase
MKVLFVSNEVVPFAKVGGLADVAGTLPTALVELGVDVRVLMPLHRACLKHGPFTPVVPALQVSLAGERMRASVLEGRLPGGKAPVYFVKYDRYFDRAEIYGEGGKDYPDAAERYAFLCQATLALPAAVDFAPDVVHVNDWMTGLLPLYAREHPPAPATLFTIHNLGYQGQFALGKAKALGLAGSALELARHQNKINYLATAIKTATLINTVSRRYAEEIQTAEYGCGLEHLLQDRSADVHGVINGIDYALWSPATDRALAANYNTEDLTGKARCKAALQAELGLTVDPSVPLLGCVTRVTTQKGLDLLASVLPAALNLPLQLALLGTGEPKLEKLYAKLAAAHPASVAAVLRFDETFARRIYAGSDLFAMPSRYEPCGLGQMIAMAYGTLPVARWTGGLADTVTEQGPSQTGFLFGEMSAPHLMGALKRAVEAYRDPARWLTVVRRAMAQDFSWTTSAARYRELYDLAAAKGRS